LTRPDYARAVPHSSGLDVGHRLDGRYELLMPYAQGGMATVWVARMRKVGFERLFAVKTILPELAADPSFRTMFLDEARIASRIQHPNVAELVDLGEEGGTLYMVFEWLDGDSWSKLYNAFAQNRLAFPPNILLRIAADACSGLHAAHELRDEHQRPLNVVHRDMSPQNVLITNTGVTKVIDFGIAKAVGRMAEETRTGLLKGKAQYAAPEQALMQPVDRRADVWAIGTILYQFLTGRLPYEGKTDIETLLALTSMRPPNPLPHWVPPPIAEVVMRALAPQREGRFATALELQRALEACITTPTSPADVALLMRMYLSERMENRRRDIEEAILEADELARTRGSLPPPAPGGTATLGSYVGPMPAAPMPLPPPPPPGPIEDNLPTRTRAGVELLTTTHWVLLFAAAIVPIVVWSLVVALLLRGPAR
jgi:serine/threonine protein kinase